MISIKKRGKNYQYCFEAGKINGKRKQITKCGFKTKKEALIAGQIAYNEYINDGLYEYRFEENKVNVISHYIIKI